MSSASFRNQIAGVVSDTLYIPVKQFLTPVGKAEKAFCFVCVGFFVCMLGFFCFKEGRGEMRGRWGKPYSESRIGKPGTMLYLQYELLIKKILDTNSLLKYFLYEIAINLSTDRFMLSDVNVT